jgi:hypothetical protein
MTTDRVIAESRYDFVVFERSDGGFVATFLLGGPVEVDVSVQLTDEEAVSVERSPASAGKMIEQFKRSLVALETRRLRPPVWPGEPKCAGPTS